MTAIPASKLTGKALHDLFVAALQDCGLPCPAIEWRFDTPRRWRFDYAWPEAKIAVEVEGGAWTRGRHTRGKGFIGDMEKYNRATVLGWRVIRVIPGHLVSVYLLVTLQELFEITPVEKETTG